MSFVATPYLGLLTALSASGVPTEQGGNAYARAATNLTYDPVSNSIAVSEGATFGVSGSGSWTASVDGAIYDASSGGNMLLDFAINSAVVTTAAPLSLPGFSIQCLPGIFNSGSVPANTQIGTIPAGSPLGNAQAVAVYSGVALKFTPAVGSTSASIAAAGTAAPVNLTYAATTNIDFSKAPSGEVPAAFAITPTGNVTFTTSNLPAGQFFELLITQDATGSRTGTFPTAWKFVGGSKTLTTTASATDKVTGYFDGTTAWCELNKAYA